MAKTTIDGLKVRESKQSSRPNKKARPSSHSIDMIQPAASDTKNTTNRTRQKALDSLDLIRKKNPTANEFLDPIETFNFDQATPEPDEATANVAEDWSNLAEATSEPDNTTATDDDFLLDWGEASESDDSLATQAIISEQEDEEAPEPATHPRRVRAHKKHHWGRIVALSTFCLLLIGGGIFYKWGDELISRITGGQSGLFGTIHSMISDTIPFETDSKGRTNVLVFGTEGYNMNGDVNGGTHDGAQLTDSILAISLDQNTKDVAMISLPRDLKVSRACSAGKINEVFWCHNQNGDNEDAGAKALMEQVGDVLGLDFQYYAHVNWASLIDIIDTIGGITVTLDENIADYNYTGAVAQAGVPMQVNGEQALGLARARHGTSGGDFTRGNTQQKIIAAIVEKVLQNGIGVSEAFNLVNILGNNLRSNFSSDNIKAGVQVLSDFDINNIRQIALVDQASNIYYMTTANINEISYVIPSAGERNYDEIHRYVAEMLENNPATLEHATISVYNASVQYGVAGAERDRLINDGYTVLNIGDAEMGDCMEQYCLYATSEDYPHTQAELEQRYHVTARPLAELPSDILPGDNNFILLIGLDGGEA